VPVQSELPKILFPPDKDGLKSIVHKNSTDADALLFGIDIEIRSYDMYKNAAEETGDPVGKELFEFDPQLEYHPARE
jgi:hypothetical protein